MNVISEDDKKKCIELFNQGLTKRQVYTQYFSERYDTKYTGFKTMLQRWKNKVELDDKLLEGGNLGYNFTPHATTVQVNGSGEVVQAWIKSHSSDDMFLQVIDCIKELKPFEPIERLIDVQSDRMLEFPFDDMHFGVATYEDYIETLADSIDIMESRPSKSIYLIIGEDLLHTNDMQGHTNKGTYIGEIDVVQAYNDTLRFYFSLLESALKNSEKVIVIYSKGNHSECLSWTIVQVLKVKFPQAIYEDSLEEDRKVITYEKIFIGVTHGEELRGNLKDIKNLFIEEHPIEYANALVKEIHIGHLHTEKDTGDINGCVVRRISSRVPTDKWHKKNGYTCNNKRFMVFEYTSTRLKSIYYV